MAPSVTLPPRARRIARWAALFIRAFGRDRAFDRAGTLAFSTLVSLVPLLMLLFAVVDAAGFLRGNVAGLEALLFGTFLGDIPEIREFLIPGLQQVDFGTIGLVGTLGLLYVASRIYLTMERAYCELFKVPVDRGLGQRLVNFYLALTAIPILLGTALLGTTTLSTRLGIPWLAEWGVALAPAVVFAVAIRQLPCTVVGWRPALIGGLTTAVLVRIGAHALSLYVAMFTGSGALAVVYGSIGIIPVFLIWLYLFWVFVLVGVELAHFVQEYPSLLRAEREDQLRAAQEERVPGPATALRLLVELSRAFSSGTGPVAAETLARTARMTETQVAPLLAALERHRLVVRTEQGWTVARPPAQITVGAIFDVWLAEQQLHPEDPLTAVMRPDPNTLARSLDEWVNAPPVL